MQLTYNRFGQLTAESQDHATTIHTGTPAVGYGYDSGGSSSNEIRLSTLTYPSGRQLNYVYNTGMDTTLNRLSTIQDNSGSVNLANYVYLGGGTVVQINYSQPGVTLDLWGGKSGTFTGFDIFGRITDQRWVTTGGSPTDRDRYKYGYDYNSNRIARDNALLSTAGEFYTYDTLNRLTVMKRGALTTSGGVYTGISGTPVWEMDYTLDPTGNWSNYVTKTALGTTLNQSRTHTTTNEISAVTASGGTPVWATPLYDSNGNTTTMPQPNAPTTSYTAVYDAWNRMVKVQSGGSSVTENTYDGRGRRIIKKKFSPPGTLTETRHFYWSNSWQDMEERVGSATTADNQQVWGIRYVDEMVCRDDATPQRLYVTQDANFRVTALLASASGGAVLERFLYDPYGPSWVLDASWGSTTDAYAWQFRYQGLYEDQETALIYNRKRFIHTLLGRFGSWDPLRYYDGPNMFAYEKNNPIKYTDSSGRCCDDLCKLTDKPRVTDIRIRFRPALREVAPKAQSTAIEALEAIKKIDELQKIGDLAGGLANGQGGEIQDILKDLLTSQADHTIGDKMEEGWDDEIVKELMTWDEKLEDTEGVAIWVELSWQKCEPERCLIFWHRNNWQDKDDSYKSNATGSGLGGIGFAKNDTKGIKSAIAGAIKEAIDEIVH